MFSNLGGQFFPLRVKVFSMEIQRKRYYSESREKGGVKIFGVGLQKIKKKTNM